MIPDVALRKWGEGGILDDVSSAPASDTVLGRKKWTKEKASCLKKRQRPTVLPKELTTTIAGEVITPQKKTF